MILNKFRNISLLCCFCICVSVAHAQTADNHILRVPHSQSQNDLLTWKKTLPTDGWFMLQFNDADDRLFNYSNKDYEMNMWFHCKGGERPGYLIEYSSNYGDGDFDGIDFISSNNDNGDKVQFILDGKNFKNPFGKGNPQWEAFAAAFKKAQKLTIRVYNKEMNPETGKDEEKLNRSIDFKMTHSELLDKPVNCGG